MKQPVRTNMSDFIKSMMGSQFVIPVYQRNYTWNPDVETERFMNDLECLLAGETTSHFLGILIYMESTISTMFKEIQIVDGQQRLTTAFILLLGLKRAAQEKKETGVTGMIEDYYLYNRHVMDRAKLRLKAAQNEDDVYSKLIYGSWLDLNKQDKESNVYRNYDYVYRRILQMNKTYPLLNILDCLSKIDILAFPLSQQDNAQQIFESINSTGAPLTSADLIRNYILMNDTSEIQERNYRLYWQPLEKLLPESRKLEEFFRYFLAAKTYQLFSKRDVYEGFKAYWKSGHGSAEDRMREINRYCRYYCEIYTESAENEIVERTLREFRKNESKVPAPFLMKLYDMMQTNKIDEKSFCGIVRLIDSYLIRRNLCGYDTGSLSRYFPQLLRSVVSAYNKTHKNILEITKLYLINYNRGKSYAMPTDAEIRTRLKEVNAYNLMCIRTVLERIEHYEATAEVMTADLNIEHIMPQNPNTWWKKNSNITDTEEYSFYANLIGNLTLCSEYDNTRMGNNDFSFKKKVLSKTLHIRLNTEILKQKTWNKECILKRCEELTDLILRIYPYEGAKDDAQSTDDSMVLLSVPTVNARAVFYDSKRVEVLAGSSMKAYGPKEMKTMKALYHEMCGNDVLSEDENGRASFNKNYMFDSLNMAAQFLMHRGGDNSKAWTLENGKAFDPEQVSKASEEAVQPKKSTNKKKRTKSKEVAQPAESESKKAARKAQPKSRKKSVKTEKNTEPKVSGPRKTPKKTVRYFRRKTDQSVSE